MTICKGLLSEDKNVSSSNDDVVLVTTFTKRRQKSVNPYWLWIIKQKESVELFTPLKLNVNLILGTHQK